MADPRLIDGRGVAGGPAQPVAVMNQPTGTNGATPVEGIPGGVPVPVTARSGVKGSTTAADLTSTASGVNHQPLDVLIYDASGNPIVSFGGGTQYADGAAAATPTGTAVNWNDTGTQRVVSAAKPLPVVQTGTPGLPTGAATETTLAAISTKTPALGSTTAAGSSPVTLATDGQFVTSIGSLTEPVPASDTASSGLNGRLQRIAQNITSLIAKFTLDSTDRIRVSLYGKNSVAGDVAALADTQGNLGVVLRAVNSTTTLAIGASSADGLSTGQNAAYALGLQTAYNGAAWDRLRTPTTFKTATATASGDTAVWTPAAGKKFRVMGYSIEVTGEATLAGAADLVITLRDATTDMNLTHSCYVPAAAPTNPGGTVFSKTVQLGNGRLSSAANAVLNVNLSAALTAGTVRVTPIGVEE